MFTFSSSLSHSHFCSHGYAIFKWKLLNVFVEIQLNLIYMYHLSACVRVNSGHLHSHMCPHVQNASYDCDCDCVCVWPSALSGYCSVCSPFVGLLLSFFRCRLLIIRIMYTVKCALLTFSICARNVFVNQMGRRLVERAWIPISITFLWAFKQWNLTRYQWATIHLNSIIRTISID